MIGKFTESDEVFLKKDPLALNDHFFCRQEWVAQSLMLLFTYDDVQFTSRCCKVRTGSKEF